MATLQDVLKENKELQKKQNATTKVTGNPASPWNKAVQTGNPNVQAGRQQISVTPTAQKQTYSTPLQAQTAASRKAVDLVGNAIGSGVSQTLSGISNIAKSVPVATEMGAKAISNLADAPVSPMTSKLTDSEIKPKEDNFVKNFTNALFGNEKEQQTVELPTQQDATKNRFENIANREMIAQGETPVKQITEWTDPWNNALEQNVENAQDFGQRYTQAVKPVTDFLDNASQKVDTYLNENVAPNLSTTEQFVTQAVGNAIPNFARQTLLGAVSGGSVPLLSTLSDVAMFLPSFYQGYEEGKQRGLSDEEAYFNAILRGGIEAGSEHLSDVWMVNGGQSQFDEWLLNKIALSGMNPFAKFVGKNMVSGIGESMEEVAARLGNTITDRAIYGDNIDVGQLALGSLEDAGAAFISTMVLGLLGGQYTNNAYRQYQNDVNRIQTENSIQEQLNSDANKYKTEMALVYANMTDEQKAQYLLQAQEQIAQKDPSDPVANMDIEELKDWVDRNAEKQIMGLTEEQYAKFIDRMNGAENPIAQTRLPNGQTFDVYEYLGNRTVDQERAIDLGNRMGKNIIIADELPMGQNALTLGDGTVIISADAKRPATALAFHEMFHSLKDNGQWEDLMGFAYETMTKEKGYENFLEDLVSRYVGYYGNIDNNYLNSIASSVDLTNEQKRQEVKDYLREQGVNQYYTDANFRGMIDEEVAADFMERFNNEDTIKAMYNRSGNMAEQMWQKLIDAVESFTGMLTQDEENLRKTEQMFADVARQNYEEAKNDIGFADDGSVYPMYSATTWNALGDIGKRQIAEEVAKQTNTEIGVAMKWIDDINSVAAIIGANKDRLDYTPNNAYTALKNDQDYIYTIDMSTLCKKRILLSNTIDEIQKMLPNVTLTGDDYIRIRQMMKDKGYEVACGFCYVESRRKFLDTVAQQFIDAVSGNPTVTNKRQLAVSSELKNKDTYIPTLYDLTTADGSNALMNEHPDVYSAFVDFNNARGQNRVKLIETRTEYNGEIMKITEGQIKKLIRQGGLRLQSYSDFETPHLIDMMQVVADMSRRGLTSQAYTKVPNFADAFGETGIKINESLVVTGVDENGELIYDDVEGMPHEIAFALRQKHPENVGTIVVGKDDETILAAMADPKIDFIIPFHKSGWKNEEYANLGIAGYKDYTNYQNERDVVSGKADVGNFYPMDYWDFSVSGDENAKTYLRMCEEQGRIPKFDNFLTKDREGHWVAPSGYWKTLIDFKMYDNDGVGVPQRVVTPTFDDAVNQRILDEYEGDHNKYSPKMDIVNEFIREKGYRYSLSDQELDEQYFDALNRGDTEEARRLLNERADERGYTDRGYHGTQQFGFTVPDTQYSDDNLSFFATDDRNTAQTYSGLDVVRPISEAYDPEALDESRDAAEQATYESAWDFANALSAMTGYQGYVTGDDILDNLQKRAESILKWGTPDDVQTAADEDTWLRLLDTWEVANQDGDTSDEAFDDWLESPEGIRLQNLAENVVQGIDTWARLMVDDPSMGIYNLAINPDNLMEFDARGNNWNDINVPDYMIPEGVDKDKYRDRNGKITTRGLAKLAKDEGYNGFALSQLYDDGGRGSSRAGASMIYDLFEPQSQVKSMDTVTYDDEGNIIPPSQRYNADNPDIRYSLDNEYLTAVEDGNVEEQDRIIEQAARNAGYNSPKVYHGTNTGDFTVFDKNMVGSNYDGWGRSGKGFYFTADESDAKIWGERGRGSKPTRVIPAYLKMDNALDLYEPAPTPVKEYIHNQFAVPENWDGTFTEDFITKSLYRTIDFLQDERHMDASDVLQSLGYDGVYSPDGVEYVVYHPSQIKSAEPVTYDDDGNIVLPSERFNYESNDIRYSLDNEYLTAVEDGNVEEQDRIIEQAARDAGYNSPKLYHGTDSFGFTQIDPSKGDDGFSFFATDSLETANSYAYGKGVKEIKDIPFTEKDLRNERGFWRDDEGVLKFLDRLGIDYTVDDNDKVRIPAWDSSFESGGHTYNTTFKGKYFTVASELYDRYLNKTSINEAFGVSPQSNTTGIYQLYGNTDGFLELDAKGNGWQNVGLGENTLDFDKWWTQEKGHESSINGVPWSSSNTRNIAAYAKDRGYPGVIIRNVVDDGGRSGVTNGKISLKSVSPASVYVFFNPQSQVKSADPEVYSDDGRLLTPSERFNPNINDIRYSVEDDIQRQIIEDSMNLNAETPQQRDETVQAIAEAMRNEDIPEQANRYKEKDNPQGRAANIFLGKLSRERNAADPYTYESISPESFPVPDRIQDYIDLINDEEDRKYGFDAPIENELTDEDKDFYQGLSANKTGALQGFATPTQTFNAIAKGEQREELRDRFERPMYETKKEYNANREQRWNALEQMIKETGIQANTPESAAVQWYGEGVKPNEQGETIPYTLDDLKREFPNKWQDIQKMERFMREMYDEYVGRINAALEQVYPNLEEKAQAQLQSWRNKKMLYQDEISMSRNPSANEYWQNEINKLDAKIAKLEGDLESGEYFRNKRLNPRKDYFHHFQEVETSGLGGLKNILQASTLIDPELVGKSEFTKPKSKWMAWLQKRGEGAYTADAVLGMGKYIDSAEYAIAFDPLIAQYRDEISKMVKATRETKNANQLIQYLSAYTNQLAGKTASLDRTILDLLGEGNRGQLFNVLAAINNRAKSNAVVGNVRSAVAQIFNIPNALGIIKSNNAWLKGANDYINAKLGNRELLDQSPFLQERYFSHNVDDLKARNTNWEKIIGKAGDITNKMMEFGDREATELIWLAAYNEGLEKNVSDPIYYADDLTRRSVAGRGIGEVPYNMKSKVASFFMPFQVETNNAWQELKQNLRDKDANGIFRLMLGSYILNGFAKLLFNDGVVPDVLGALIDGIKKLFDKDREESVGEVALNTGKRIAGEAVSYIPGTSLWLPAIMSDESAEALFGDSDPTRYGTGTVGLSTITKTLADAVDGGDFDIVTPLLQMGLPYGGRQASRLYNTLQDFNVLPSNGVMNTPIGGEKNPVAGDYTQAGALKYRLPEEVNSAADVAEIARALAFGSNSTNAASEYYDTLKPVLSKERVAKLREHPEVNPDTYIDYLNEASTDGKQGITQQEAYDWISSHNLSDEEANALWEMTSSSWKKSYDEYQPKETKEETPTETPKEEKKEEKQNRKKSGKPTTKKEFTDAADANNSGRLSQAEAYDWLNSQKLSDAEKEALWNLMGWKTDYETYASKH